MATSATPAQSAMRESFIDEPRMRRPVVRSTLTEIGLGLEAIHKASAREKSIRHGHPPTLHLWWLPLPLQREPDFGVTSVNCDSAELLARAEAPR